MSHCDLVMSSNRPPPHTVICNPIESSNRPPCARAHTHAYTHIHTRWEVGYGGGFRCDPESSRQSRTPHLPSDLEEAGFVIPDGLILPHCPPLPRLLQTTAPSCVISSQPSPQVFFYRSVCVLSDCKPPEGSVGIVVCLPHWGPVCHPMPSMGAARQLPTLAAVCWLCGPGDVCSLSPL